MEQLESQVSVDREPPATLPITEGSRASSHSSIDALPPSTLTTHHRTGSPEDGEVYTCLHFINLEKLVHVHCGPVWYIYHISSRKNSKMLHP